MPNEENTPKSNAPSTPIDNLIYAPEDPGKTKRKTSRRRRAPVLASRNAIPPTPPTEKPGKNSQIENEERMTLSEAFRVGDGDGRDDERAVRACALLLDWASEVGNNKVDGFMAYGICQALQLVAERMAPMQTRRNHGA
jgi:hypothetical protein